MQVARHPVDGAHTCRRAGELHVVQGTLGLVRGLFRGEGAYFRSLTPTHVVLGKA